MGTVTNAWGRITIVCHITYYWIWNLNELIHVCLWVNIEKICLNLVCKIKPEGTLIFISKVTDSCQKRDCCGRDRMVVVFTTTYAVSAYHHWSCDFFESRSWWGVLDTTSCDNIIYSYKYLESDLIKYCHMIFIHSLGQPLIVRSHSKVHHLQGNPKEVPTWASRVSNYSYFPWFNRQQTWHPATGLSL